MLVEISPEEYRDHFKIDPHPFISDAYIEVNKHKVDRVSRLISDNGKVSIGLIIGHYGQVIKSPISAPFGGFHCLSDEIFIGEISEFILQLKEYFLKNDFLRIEITLPPDIYHTSLNAKFFNSLIRNGFQMAIPEITNWINLRTFEGNFMKKEVQKNIRHAIRNLLKFECVYNNADKFEAFGIISQNRNCRGRKIHMSFEDVIEITKILKVDFFLVKDSFGENVASAIIYVSQSNIAQVIFWGDTDKGRCYRAMDFLVLKLYNYYKDKGFDFLDIGLSSLKGVPNEGLIRFKEIHNCVSSIRHSFFIQKKA
jgi:hypothetical protein